MDYYFQDTWRMDWGLDNPNKTAALIAVLMIAVWGFAFWRRWGFWLSLVLFTGLGVCQVHTFSRGGMLSLGVGLIPLVWLVWTKRQAWKKAHWIGTALSLWIMIGCAVYFQAYERYAQGIVKQDRSISNRLEIWEKVPRMILDSPGGWGLGNSGTIFNEWYQPLDQTENYRTLVNSHLTWLVEFGWPLRVLYIMGWMMALLFCWPSARKPWLSLCLGIWLAFAVSALFSSVAESPWLWALPVGALVWALASRVVGRDWLPAWVWALPPATVVICVFSLWACAQAQRKWPMGGGSGYVWIGQPKPETWVLLDEKVFGKEPGRTLRTFLHEKKTMPSVGLAQEINVLPEGVLDTVIVGGELPEAQLQRLKSRMSDIKCLVLVNPDFSPEELVQGEGLKPEIKVMFGSFSQSGQMYAWESVLDKPVERIEGAGDYYAAWPSLTESATAKGGM